MALAVRRTFVTILAASLTAATGCGGGGGGTPAPSRVAVRARVVDGAIRNALVCLDVNANGRCDAGEVQGRTDAAGNVTLQVPPADAGRYVILAVVGTDAVDADAGPVTTAYVLKAPADQPAVVSPLTTLVQAQVETTGASTATAATFVQGQAGLSVSPLADYTADAGAGATQAAALARLVVLTTQLEATALAPAIVGQQDLAGTTVTQADLDGAILRASLAALPTLAAAAASPAVATATDAAGKAAALTAAAQGLVTSEALLAPDAALADIGIARLAPELVSTAAVESATLRALVFTDASNWYYRAMESTAADNTPDANGLVHYYDVHEKAVGGVVTTWGYNPDPARQGDLHWNGTAWVDCPLGFRNSQYPRDAQGRTSYNYCDGWERGTTQRTSIDISGQTLSDVVTQRIRTFPGSGSGVRFAAWGPADLALLGTATFPAGSKLHYQTGVTTSTAPSYDVQAATTVSAFTAAIAAGGDATTGSPACAGTLTQTILATLEDLVALNPGNPCIFTPTAQTGPTNAWWSNSTVGMGTLAASVTPPTSYYTTSQPLRVAFGPGQAARFYGCLQRASDGSVRNCTLLATGSYAIQTLGDARVMTFSGLPPESTRLGWSRVFIERGGNVRFGYQNLAGAVTQDVRLNLTAANAILGQLGLDPIQPH